MRPIPSSLLLVLILLLCGLCALQWHRESELRDIVLRQGAELASLRAAQGEIEARVKTADAEILRLTASTSELRDNSVSKQQYDGALQANLQMKADVEKLNEAIKQRDKSLVAA